tara:strand:- start:381 stop:527 length:147 start_codon:yes stop_codon:yes gene_type:complete
LCGRERKTNKRYKKKGDFVIIFVEKNGKNPGIKTHGVWPKKNSSELSS